MLPSPPLPGPIPPDAAPPQPPFFICRSVLNELEALVRSQDMPADHAAAYAFVLRRANILYACGKNVSWGAGCVLGVLLGRCLEPIQLDAREQQNTQENPCEHPLSRAGGVPRCHAARAGRHAARAGGRALPGKLFLCGCGRALCCRQPWILQQAATRGLALLAARATLPCHPQQPTSLS